VTLSMVAWLIHCSGCSRRPRVGTVKHAMYSVDDEGSSESSPPSIDPVDAARSPAEVASSPRREVLPSYRRSSRRTFSPATAARSLTYRHVINIPAKINKKLTCRRETARCFVSLMISLSHSSSSRMRVIYHNWSATKQRPHPQSVAEISHHSVLSGDRIRQCETSSGSRHKDTDQCL